MSSSSTNLNLPDDPLEWPLEDVLCELGAQSGLGLLYEDDGQEIHAMPIPTGRYRPPGPYPETFYRAQKWLRRNRAELQRAIIEKFDYGAKKDLYSRGNEQVLIHDLAKVIAPLCKEPYPVEPMIAAATLVKIGLDKFCYGYDDPNSDPKSFSLEHALGLNPYAANVAAAKGNALLMVGRWKEAVPHYEEALSSYALHLGALNDMAYIYATYVPGHPKGLEYARRALSQTIFFDKGLECSVQDTAGWAIYRHARRLDRAEVHLREALALLTPGEQFYPSVAYHLIAVLVDAGRLEEAKHLFENFSRLPAMHLFDKQSIRAARSLLGWRGRLRRLLMRLLPINM